MKGDPFAPLAYALWEDLKQPEVLWQVAALLLCLALAWAISRAIRLPKVEQSSVWRFGGGGLNRLLFPLPHVFGRGGIIAAFDRLIALIVWSAVALHILGLLPAVTEFLEDIGF